MRNDLWAVQIRLDAFERESCRILRYLPIHPTPYTLHPTPFIRKAIGDLNRTTHHQSLIIQPTSGIYCGLSKRRIK
jgi:hypothetical protein